MLLLLVRHAETPATGKRLTGWLPGHHLSPEGVRQAESLGKRLAEVPLDAMFSSPLERCRETAAAIAAHHQIPVTPLDDLGEVRYGDWQGRPLKALYRTKAWAALHDRPADFRFPGGESVREAQTRAMRAVESLALAHADHAVVAVSHADIIRLVVAGYLGLGLDLYQRISIAAASVTTIYLGSRVPRILSVGDAGSLEPFVARLKGGAG